MILKHIEEKAEQLLKSYDYYFPGFDIVSLVKKLKIDLVKKTFENDISGLLAINNNKTIISYNGSEDKKRQRFTIAHELGHYILHSKEQPLFIDKLPKVMYRNNASSTGEILKEREANAFAAALLMPKDLVAKKVEEYSYNGHTAIEDIAKDFKVSVQAMSFRLSNLGYYLG